jgi:hypothetical protein
MSTETLAQQSTESLAQQWAQKYVQNLELSGQDNLLSDQLDLARVVSQSGREQTAEKLLNALRFVSAQAWNKTEILLAKEVRRHQIDPELIDPWEIAADSFRIYDKVLSVYTQKSKSRHLSVCVTLGGSNSSTPVCEKTIEVCTDRVEPSHLSVVVGSDIGKIRQKYTENDPRLIGFVSMQFHYTSQMLLELLSPLEQMLVGAYFKVIDDHLYMPLQRAYNAAAQYEYNSPLLQAVHQWLPLGTDIATQICQQILREYPLYRSHGGKLSHSQVQISSIRDVEMFQVYLWVCALEGNIDVVQQELFPLCVMLYPPLRVDWELVRRLVSLLEQHIKINLKPKSFSVFEPYFLSLEQMFSPEVLQA